MADPNISKHSIEEVKDAISRRLASHPPSVGDADASVGQEAINEQNKVLSRRELTKGIFALLIAGYVITTAILLLSGWQVGGFYLEPYVLAVLVGSSMGSTAIMFRRITDMIFG